METVNGNNILIIGASGFLGSKLFRELVKKWNVVGTFCSKRRDDLKQLDTSDQKTLIPFLQTIQPSIIIDCGGITRPDICELNQQQAYQVNVQGVRNLVNFSSCKIIYLSTDYVFDGQKEFYSEEDQPNPINFYGWTKHEAEKIILNARADNVVIRVSGLYGYNSENNEFLTLLSNFAYVIRVFDCYSSNLLIDDVVKNIDFFRTASGIYHFTDGEALTRSEFTIKAVDILNLPTKVIEKSSREIYTKAQRPINSSLISIRHNIQIHGSEAGLLYVKEQLYNEI